MNIIILGLSITSSWGNGHATTYRGLVRELAARGHAVRFLERDLSWYAANRDAPRFAHAEVILYNSLAALKRDHASSVRAADAVIVGSFVPEGIEVGRWVLAEATGVVAFYDIDTPVTLAAIERGDSTYLSRELIPGYDLYLSFTGGPILQRLENEFGSPRACPLYCSVDPGNYFPMRGETVWDLGYLGTFSEDRQERLKQLLLRPATQWPKGRFIVAGPQYPVTTQWPPNVARTNHLPPSHHCLFYNQQRFTLNLTRANMIAAGHSPSVRLFEAAACGTPIISDSWPGLEEFFTPGKEILVARSTTDVLAYLKEFSVASAREIGLAARKKVLSHHTAAHRAVQLENYLLEAATAEGKAGTWIDRDRATGTVHM